MALLCELPGIIKEIKVKTETLNFGELWEKTHSHKPSPLPTFGESVEEKETLELKKKRDNMSSSLTNVSYNNRKQNSNGYTAAGTLKKTKVIVFELPQEDPAVEFLKEPIEDIPMEQSGLSKLIGSSGSIEVDVFIPNSKKPIKVKVPQSATFQQLVMATIKKRNEGKGQGKLEQDPDAYIVRIATENGQADDMFPALAKKGKVERWHNVPFLLIENPNYKPNPMNNSEKTYLRINLPDGAFHTSMVEKNMKISKILNNICAKRQLVPSDYFLQVANDPDKMVGSDTRISDLKDPTLNLVQRNLTNSNDTMYIDEINTTSSTKKKKTQSKNVNN